MKIHITDTFIESLKKLKRYNISFYSFRQSIKSLIIWFPIIWKDQWWDHTFFYTILHFKLSLMEKGFRKDGNSIIHKEQADEIKLCVLILDRLIKDDYTSFDSHNKKWGQLEMKFGPPNKEGNTPLDITRPNVKTEKDEKQERIESKHWHDIEESTIKNDLFLLFKQIEKHVRRWWD